MTNKLRHSPFGVPSQHFVFGLAMPKLSTYQVLCNLFAFLFWLAPLLSNKNAPKDGGKLTTRESFFTIITYASLLN